MKDNKSLLEEELKALRDGKHVIKPIPILINSSWDLIKINFPKKISNDSKLLVEIRSIMITICSVNETIRSREMYRQNNGAMSNFNNRMKIYDDILLQDTDPLIKNLESLRGKLEEK